MVNELESSIKTCRGETFAFMFYVIFPVSEDERTEKSEKPFETKYYEVDEQYFMSKMHEWGVKIENGLPPEKRKKYPWDWA